MSKEKNVNKSTSAPVYKSRYSDAVKNNLTKVLDGKKFSYDVNNDKLFAQYKDSYTKAGKTAMEDTVGNASALTGGYANSYAVTAGQQAYDSYMAKLNDKIPELEQRAYERYRDDEESAYKRLNTLIGLENTDYSRYRDSMSDYNTNREFEYNKSKDAQAETGRLSSTGISMRTIVIITVMCMKMTESITVMCLKTIVIIIGMFMKVTGIMHRTLLTANVIIGSN